MSSLHTGFHRKLLGRDTAQEDALRHTGSRADDAPAVTMDGGLGMQEMT